MTIKSKKKKMGKCNAYQEGHNNNKMYLSYIRRKNYDKIFATVVVCCCC